MIWFIAYILIGLAIATLLFSPSYIQGRIKDILQADGFEEWLRILIVGLAVAYKAVTWPIDLIRIIGAIIVVVIVELTEK